jgi:surfeit locus 1 family protein
VATRRLLLIAGFIGFAAVCARLGIWQVHRLQQRRAMNARALTARSAPRVTLTSESLAGDSVANRRVLAVGHYDHAHDIVLRGREYGGVPGVEIASPLLLRDGKVAVLVNRGFVPSPDAVTADPDTLREPGELRVQGIALPIDSAGGAPLRSRQRTTWSRLDLKSLRDSLPYPIGSMYIRLAPDTTRRRFPRPLDLPVLDDGPHLSYAIQWFSFALLALVFGVVILRQQHKPDQDQRLRPKD